VGAFDIPVPKPPPLASMPARSLPGEQGNMCRGRDERATSGHGSNAWSGKSSQVSHRDKFQGTLIEVQPWVP